VVSFQFFKISIFNITLKTVLKGIVLFKQDNKIFFYFFNSEVKRIFVT